MTSKHGPTIFMDARIKIRVYQDSFIYFEMSLLVSIVCDSCPEDVSRQQTICEVSIRFKINHGEISTIITATPTMCL